MSDASTIVSRLCASRNSRAAYLKGKLSILIPAQIRALRLKSETPRQEDLAREADMKQSRISAMEKPGAVSFNLETLVRVASVLKVGLVVKFVPFSEMLRWENEFSQDAFNPVTIEKDTEFIEGAPAVPAAATAAVAAAQTQNVMFDQSGSSYQISPSDLNAISGVSWTGQLNSQQALGRLEQAGSLM